MQRKQVKNSNGAIKSSAEHYEIWAMNGYPLKKFRQETNLDNPKSPNHTFLWRYSEQYVEGIIGEPRHLIELSEDNMISLEKVLK